LDIRSDQPVRNVQAVGASPGLPSASTESDQFQILLEEMKLQRELFQQMFIAMQSNRQVAAASPVVSFGGSEQAMISNVLERLPSASPAASASSSVRSGTSILSTVPAAQAIILLSSQIPSFGGSPDENVDLWLKKVERVSRVHNVSEDVMLLAAFSKLTKLARDWFDLDTGTINDSWSTFKIAVTKRFHRQIPFHVIVQKVEERKWNYSKEMFQKYAFNKLKLMQNLNLQSSDQINFLITDIDSSSLRATAVALGATSVDQFLERMHDITIVCNDSATSNRQQASSSKQEKHKVKSTSELLAKGDDAAKIAKDLYCVLQIERAGLCVDCSKLKKKEQNQPASSSTVPASISAVESTSPVIVAAVDASPARPADVSPSEAPVTLREPVLVNSGSQVTSFNDIPCELNS